MAQLVVVPSLVSRGIYLSGGPLGRALTEVARNPFKPDTTAADLEQGFAKWERAVATPM